MREKWEDFRDVLGGLWLVALPMMITVPLALFAVYVFGCNVS